MAKRAAKPRSPAPESASAPAPFAVPSWPADKIERRRIAELKPFARNPRLHSDEQVAQIAAAIKRFGWTIPLLIDEGGTLIAGHGRLLAAKAIGIEEAPVIVARGWSDDEKEAYLIADNKIAANSTWDDELLRFGLTGLQQRGFDLELTGFGGVELVSFLSGLGEGGQGGSGPAPTVGNLAERFGAVPFSVLNAREGWWQDRKRAWLSLGIKSEVGRAENLLNFSDTLIEPDPAKRAAKGMKPGKASARSAMRTVRLNAKKRGELVEEHGRATALIGGEV